MEIFDFGFGLATGGALGFVVHWWRLKYKISEAMSPHLVERQSLAIKFEINQKKLEELVQILQFKEKELAVLQKDYSEVISIKSMLEERVSRMHTLESMLESQRRDLAQLMTKNAELNSYLEQERLGNQEKIKLLDEMQQRITETFRMLSAEALSSNNKAFLSLASHNFEKFQTSALAPMNESLNKVEGHIRELEKNRQSAYEVLKQQVYELARGQKDLQGATVNLVQALRAPTTRGQWGEMQLKRVVEIAGMIDHCDFQQQVQTDENKLRPDMVINLPGNKKIVVDAKAPLAAYLEALENDNEQVKQQKLTDHARHVRHHIRSLSQKSYWEQFENTPEFVILFLPGETFFAAALEKDPALIEVGVRERVILATPTTLIALLRAVAYGWSQESLAQDAKETVLLSKELYKRLRDLASYLNKLGKSINQTVELYNQGVGNIERRVLPAARKLKSLSSSHDEIEEINPLDAQVRQFQAQELLPTKTSDLYPQSDNEEAIAF